MAVKAPARGWPTPTVSSMRPSGAGVAVARVGVEGWPTEVNDEAFAVGPSRPAPLVSVAE